MKEDTKPTLAHLRQQDQEFQEWFATVPQEWRAEADDLYQEGVLLPDIVETIAAYQDTTQYPLLLTRYELDTLAASLCYRSDLSNEERALQAKMDTLRSEMENRRKPAP